MLRVVFEKKQIHIRFRHNICGSYEIECLTGMSVHEDRRCSFATVDIDGEHIGQGVVVCHPSDNFNKSFGRKRALTYAINPLHKVIREAIWKEYGNQIGF